MKRLYTILVIMSALLRAMEHDEKSLHITPYHINNPDFFNPSPIAIDRIEHLENEYKNRCKTRIRFRSKSIDLSDSILEVIVKKEMAIGLCQLQARIAWEKEKHTKDEYAFDSNADDRLMTKWDRVDMLESIEEIEPFEKKSYALMTKNYQEALYFRLFKVYKEMRTKPYLIYALYMWAIKDLKIQPEHGLVFQDTLKEWTSNYVDLKKDDRCVIL